METKDLYQEIGTNFRYFLDWRHKLLAGYLVSIAGLAIGFSWAITSSIAKDHSWIILIIGFILSLVFWALDVRNRDLYHDCLRAGKAVEEKANISDGQGIYTTLETNKPFLPHGTVLNIMFSIASLGFLIGAILVACNCL